MLQVTIPSADPPKQPIYGNVRRSRYNIVIVALCFAVIFSAYNTLQNYITTLFPTLGQSSLAILYAVAGISVFAGPAFTAALGARLTMIVGGACYVVYVASLAAAATPAMSGFANALIYIASAVIGFGAAILWVALGVFITQNSTRTTYATNTGIFWSVFQLNNIIGNLTTWAIYTPSLSSSPTLYLGFAGVATVGTLMLFALRPPPRFATNPNGDEIELNEDAVHIEAQDTPLPDPYSDAYRELSGVEEVGKGAEVGGKSDIKSHHYNCARSYRHFTKTLGEAGQGAWAAALHLKDANMLLLLPVFILSGAELAFWTGEL
jgi:MFS family permease